MRGNVKNLSMAGKKDTKSDSEKLAELMGQEFNPSHGRWYSIKGDNLVNIIKKN